MCVCVCVFSLCTTADIQILLDADQPVDNRTDEYALKFRFWFQDYTPAVPATPHAVAQPASHSNLHRIYYMTEVWAVEYDVEKCRPETPPEDCIHEISARFQVRVWPWCLVDCCS